MDRASKNNYKFICFTAVGRELMEKILLQIPGETSTCSPDKLETGGLSDWTRENFKKGNVLVFIGACGIAPAVSINGKVYPKVSVNQVHDIVASYQDAEKGAAV